ncbi:MAG: DUF4129 domain-containing protein [Bacteroidetes bacterium]|nr:DUF4129 domain-containing protein [Bacteroidota bacterium]MCB0843606.1 DUF4129 domain-containing protein [Bacteroidota bacterium]
MNRIIIYLTVAICLGLSPTGNLFSKQNTKRSFSEESLEKFQDDKNFQYGEEPLPEKFEPRKKNTNLGGLMEILMYVAIVALIIVLIYLVSKNTVSKSSRKITSDEIPELVEKDITEVDFDELIKRTAASGDYRKAVRLLYLESLKTLNHKKWINWKPYKTNYEYQLELSGTKLQSSFDRLTYNFEYIWYGHFDIDQAVYQQLERGFKDFQSGIVFKK